MRRHATMSLAFALPLAVSVAALAQTTPAKTGTGASPTAGTTAGPAAATPVTSGKGDAGASSASTTATPDGGASTGMTALTTTTAGTDGGVSVDLNRPRDSQMDGATYAVRLRDLQQRVDELKDQIRRSHTRLALLSDTIVGGGVAGSRSEITFQNEMSSAFRLTRALFVLDGAVQYNRNDDSGALADQKEIPIFSGSIPPGDHTISVILNFQGNGYGVFTYLRGYKFEAKSSHSFTAVEGKTLSVNVMALEKGGVTTPLEERPSIQFTEKVLALGGGPSLGPQPPAAAAGASGASGGASANPGGVKAGGSLQVGGKP